VVETLSSRFGSGAGTGDARLIGGCLFHTGACTLNDGYAFVEGLAWSANVAPAHLRAQESAFYEGSRPAWHDGQDRALSAALF
jgi:hypothetical protein